MAKTPNRLNLADKLAAELASNPVTITPPRVSDRTDHSHPNVSLANVTTAQPAAYTTDTTDHLSKDNATQRPTTPPDHLTTDPPDHLPDTLPISGHEHPPTQHITAPPTSSATNHATSGSSGSPPSGQPAALSQDSQTHRTDWPEREGRETNGRARPSSIKPCRVDVMRVSGFFSERVKYQIQQLQWKYSQTTEEEMVGQALNLLFRYEGMPEIAFEGKDTRKRPITLRPPQE